VTRFTVWAAAMLILIPVATLPVNEICDQKGRRGKYFVDVRVGGEEGAGVSFTNDNVDYTGWETSFFEEFSEEDCGETVTFGGFCDDGVSGGQCRCHFVCEEHHWDIE
jgi:hypothetical protein